MSFTMRNKSSLLLDPESNVYESSTPQRKVRCSLRSKALLAALILISIVIAVSSIAAILLNKHKTTSSFADKTPPKVPVSISAPLQLQNSEGKIICTQVSQCADQTIVGNDIVCFGNGTCSQSELRTSATSGSINCVSDYSCFSAKLMIATGLDSTINCEAYRSCMSVASGVALSGDLYCTALQSCYDMSSYVRAKYIECSGEQSCASSVHYHAADDYSVASYRADTVNCTGKWSCARSTFYAKEIHVFSGQNPIEGADIFAEKSESVEVHLYVDSSGSFGNIHCKDEATCDVHCYTHDACVYMNVYVYSNDTCVNIHCDHVVCPAVWYIDHDEDDTHTESEPTHALDNTMVFNDNNGLNLNDEMFDVGRDWVLNGNFNFIYYQDMDHTATEEDKNASKSLNAAKIYNKVSSSLNLSGQ